MKKVNQAISLALVAMIAFSTLSLFRVQLAGISILIGVAIYTVINTKKRSHSFTALDIKRAYRELTESSICLWALLPLSINIVVLFLAKVFFPEFLEHIGGRTAHLGIGILLVVQLMVSALGEEIAWRAFFQHELTKIVPVKPAIVITSIVFAIAHFSPGNLVIAIIDVFLVFLNSVIYGIIFAKSKNAFVSSLAHFAANLVAIVLLRLI